MFFCCFLGVVIGLNACSAVYMVFIAWCLVYYVVLLLTLMMLVGFGVGWFIVVCLVAGLWTWDFLNSLSGRALTFCLGLIDDCLD